MLDEQILMPVKGLDLEVGIHPQVLKVLAKGQWGVAIQQNLEYKNEFSQSGYQADGIRAIAGQSWLLPFKEFE
jgi:hypothetical protein